VKIFYNSFELQVTAHMSADDVYRTLLDQGERRRPSNGLSCFNRQFETADLVSAPITLKQALLFLNWRKAIITIT